MTSQQQPGLYPYVTDIKVVDPFHYPNMVQVSDASMSSLTSSNLAIANNNNMFNIRTEVRSDHAVHMVLEKMQRQDFHEEYFINEAAVDYRTRLSILDVSLTGDLSASTIGVSAEFIVGPSAELFQSHPQLRINSDKLYLMYNYSNELIFNQYQIIGGQADLSLMWSTRPSRLGDGDVSVSVPVPYSTKQCGFMEDANNMYTYRLDGSTVTVGQVVKSTGVYSTSLFKFTMDDGITDIEMIMPSGSSNAYLISSTGNVRAKVINFGATDTNGFITTQTAQRVSNSEDELTYFGFDNMLTVAIGSNNNNEIILGNLTVCGELLQTPQLFAINKEEMFGEVPLGQQTTMAVASCTNPLNPNFIYFAYVSKDNRVRVIKFYRHLTTSIIYSYVYLIMWSTRLGAIDMTLDSGGYGHNIKIVADRFGVIYVSVHEMGKKYRMWRILEHAIDLGHAVGSITAPVDTMKTALRLINDQYTLSTAEMSLLINGFPAINDPVIVDVNENTVEITPGQTDTVRQLSLKYLNYNIIQLDQVLQDEIQSNLNTAFRTLYAGSLTSVDILNMDGVIMGGVGEQLIIQIPLNAGKEPCVVRGTEIVQYDLVTGRPKLTPIERLHKGDYIVNQYGRPVQILSHSIDTVYAKSHNAPYVIPQNFFGQDRPYRKLFISGDHGILARKGHMVYAEDMRRVFRQIGHGMDIEYHHLVLHNDKRNCYIANGLEVESNHVGPYMRRPK